MRLQNFRKRHLKGAAFAAAAVVVFMLCAFLFACGGDKEKKAAEPVGMELGYTEVTLAPGSRCKIKAEVETDDGSEYEGFVTWVSSDESVATVASGIVEAVNDGEAVVTVSVRGHEDISASCPVKVTSENVLRVGVKTDVKGFGYYNPNVREYEGLEIDIAREMADELGYDGVALSGILSAEREEALSGGVVDCIIATYTITEERQETMYFSDPYYTDYVRVLVGEEYRDAAYDVSVTVKDDETGEEEEISETKKITNVETLLEYIASTYDASNPYNPEYETCLVATAAGTTGYDSFSEYLENGEFTYFDALRYEYCENVVYEDYDACENALESGEVQAFVADMSILSSHMDKNRTFLLEDEFGAQDYGVATLDEKLRDDVNVLLAAWSEDGGYLSNLLESYGLD